MILFRPFLFLMLLSLSVSGQEKKEFLKINLPEQYNWKVISDRSDGPLHVLDFIPGNEEAGKWSIMATMKRVEGEVFVPMEIAMNNTFNLARQKSQKASIMLVEKDKDEKNHWIIFKIESAGHSGDRAIESRLFYIIQGETSLFSASVSVKEKNLSNEFVAKWAEIFKKSVLEYATGQDLQGFRIGMIDQ